MAFSIKFFDFPLIFSDSFLEVIVGASIFVVDVGVVIIVVDSVVESMTFRPEIVGLSVVFKDFFGSSTFNSLGISTEATVDAIYKLAFERNFFSSKICQTTYIVTYQECN